MVEKFKGSIRLDWINKDKSLYYEIDEEEGRGIKPKWVDKNDISVAEPRVLKLVKEIGDISNLKDPLDNALIRGDNLLALRTLVELFKHREEKDKVKCIYIDPPFNTGNAFDKYDDNLRHSEWLTMMRDRLILLKKLLRNDGVILVHIDHEEMPYLKVLLDEIFSRKNLISIIAVKVKDPAGVGQESPIFDVCEYILFYAKDITIAKDDIFKKSYEFAEILEPVNGYNKIILSEGKPKLVKVIERQNVGKINIFKCEGYEIKKLEKNISLEDYKKLYQRIFVDYNPSGGMILAIKEDIPEEGLSYIEYTPTKGRDKGRLSKVYFHNQRILAWLKHIVIQDGKRLLKRQKISNLWEISTAGLSNEGGVYFPQSKKPETLIKKIIELCTEKGDLILDSFAGSGTTGAVAHKMGRCWIMVELGKHAETLCKERLKRVVEGEDQTGISKDVNWQGSGGFRYYKLGDSLIKDQDLNWTLNHEGEDIAKSIFMTFDFRFKERMKEGIFIGKSGKKIALCVLSKDLKIIQKNELKGLIKEVSKKYPYDHLTIYTNCGIAIKDEDIEENLDIKKVPEIILKKYKM